MATFSPGVGRPFGTPGVPTPPTPLIAGALLFERYRLEQQLGAGGMAEVWRAHDEQLDRPVAIKLLHRHLLPDEKSRARFAAEARTVAGLSHPGIVTVHDILVDDAQAAMVLELVDGEPLSEVIARTGRLPEAAAAAIAAQVAYALQAAHDHGLVHRDVKPANVLLSADGRARLVDFGIARALDDRDPALTMPGTIMGTLRYMAPEQLADGGADRATDVFGLGSLLYEMLVARPPFPAATPAALMAQQRQGAPQIRGVSPELAGLARSALHTDAERRPRSAGRMAAMIERWLEHKGVAAADLTAVVAASLGGLPLPRPLAPGVVPTPSDGPARPPEPVDPADPSRAVSPPAAIDAVGAAAFGSAATLGSAAAAGTADASEVPGPPPAVPPPAPPPLAAGAESVDTAAVTAPQRGGSVRPFALVWRRVPLVAALGLAGLLLAGLLLAGSLAGLQAGSSRSATPSPSARVVPAATARPASLAPAATAAPIRVIPERPKPPRVDKPPKDDTDKKKRD